MKKFYVIALIISIIYAYNNLSEDSRHPPRDIEISSNELCMADEDTVSIETSPNKETYLNVEDEVLICLAYVENYSERSYFCGKRWTIGYGSTYYADGTRVQSNEQITMLQAQKCVRQHLRRYVFPYIDKYVKRRLSRQEIIGTSMFIYNIGSENFKQSAFLQAVNNGKSSKECARRMTEFSKSGGKTALGLLKREWVQGAIYCGHISPHELLNLKPAGFYNFGLSEFYNNQYRLWDGFYDYNFSQQKIKSFLHKNKSNDLRVIDII